MPQRIREAFANRHVPALQPGIHAADKRRVEEDHDEVADKVKGKQGPVEEEVPEKLPDDQRQDEGRKHDERYYTGEEREHEEFLVRHENPPARPEELDAPANAFKHTISVDSSTR